METSMPSKQYRIQSFWGDFHAGHLKDGTQVFLCIGVVDSQLIAVLFDPQGDYLKTLTKEMSQSTMRYTDVSWEDLEDWATELGFVQGVISVKKFNFPDYEFEFGILDLPKIYLELIQESIDKGEEIPADIQEEIANWKEGNDYVLVYYREYDIDKDGEVVST